MKALYIIRIIVGLLITYWTFRLFSPQHSPGLYRWKQVSSNPLEFWETKSLLYGQYRMERERNQIIGIQKIRKGGNTDYL